MEVHSKCLHSCIMIFRSTWNLFFSSLLHLGGQNDRYTFRLGQVSAWGFSEKYCTETDLRLFLLSYMNSTKLKKHLPFTSTQQRKGSTIPGTRTDSILKQKEDGGGAQDQWHDVRVEFNLEYVWSWYVGKSHKLHNSIGQLFYLYFKLQ